MKKQLMMSVMVTAVVALVVMTGCKKKAEPAVTKKPVDPYHVASVEERMNDSEYVKQLDAQRDQQKKLVKLASQATNDADRAAVAAALEKNRKETMRLIRERMKSPAR